MLKYPNIIILALSTLAPSLSNGQYGADGAVAALGHGVLWSMEKEDLDNLIQGQDLLLISNVALALEEAKLLDISSQRYKSLSEVDDSVRNAGVLAQILEHSYRLGDIQISIYEMMDNYPLVNAAISPALIDLLLDQAFLMNDIAVTLTEGETNLMNSSERLLYMKLLLNKIDEINDLAVEIKGQAYQLIQLVELQQLDPAEIPQIDYTSPIQNIEIEIASLISN